MHRRSSSAAAALVILLCAAVSIAGAALASVQFVASADGLDSNDSLEWSSVGAAGSYPANPILTESALGNPLTVSLASGNGAIVLQGSGWSGSFPPGTFAFYNQGSGDCTIQFGLPVQGFGTTLDSGSQSSFSAKIEAFAGATSLGQFPASTVAHTLLYLGVSDSVAEITSVKLHDDTNAYFAVGALQIVPEAASRESCEAAELGLLVLVALRRRA